MKPADPAATGPGRPSRARPTDEGRRLAHHQTFGSADGPEDVDSQVGQVGQEGVDFTLVVPAYNEAGRIRGGAARLRQACASGALDVERTEVLVIDDASDDGTGQQASELLGDLPHLKVLRLDRHTGKGGSVRAGVSRARGSQVAFLDADAAVVPTQLPALREALGHADVAIGARHLDGSDVDVPSVVRAVGGRVFNATVNLLTGVGLRDTQCGFKAFRTPVARLLLHCSVIDGFAFDVEVLLLARRFGFLVAEVPVSWLRVEGSSIHPVRDPARMLADVAAVRLGSRRTPKVPMLLVASHLQPEAIARLFGGRQPVLPWGEGRTGVLLPLVDQVGRRRAELALRRADPEAGIERRSLSVGDLERRAPLRLVGSAAGGLEGPPGSPPPTRASVP